MRPVARWLLASILILAIPFAPPVSAQAAACQFEGGFQTLHDLIPDTVGDCLRDAHYSSLTGDGFQETTGPEGNGGLLVWRKATNITSFTDGYRTWLLGPLGFQVRLNTAKFDWEHTIPLPVTSPCREGDPLANVHDPARLLVVTPCQAVTGVVSRVRLEHDGDIFVNLKLGASERVLLNARNVARQRGTLVLEIVPADQPGCVLGLPPRPPLGSADFGICTGANLPTPAVGSAIEAIGPYVLDTNHGWMEIHPVWRIIPVPELD